MFMTNVAATISVADDARNFARRETAIEGGVRRSGASRMPATVRDISVSGFRVDTLERLPMASVIWLKVDGLEALMAQVVWSEGRSAGCRFAAPLHPSVVDRLVAAPG